MGVQCTICTESYSSEKITSATACGHVYHHDCLVEWLNTSSTCPQCRERCDISLLKRVYLDYVPNEPRPSTSKAFSVLDARKRELEHALKMDGETDETIRQLFKQIDDESMNNKEYINQLGEFDTQSEEISKLKSLLEDNAEDFKNCIATIDDLNGKNYALEEILEDEKRRNWDLRTENHVMEEKLNELTVKLQSAEDALTSAQEHRDLAEQKANKAEWEYDTFVGSLRSQSKDFLTVLMQLRGETDSKCRQLMEVKQVTEDCMRAATQMNTGFDLQIEKLRQIDRKLQTTENRLSQKMHPVIDDCVSSLQSLPTKEIPGEMTEGEACDRNDDGYSIARILEILCKQKTYRLQNDYINLH